MPVIRRAAARFARLRYFLPAVALALSAALIDHPAVLIALLLAQPLYLAGAISLLGYSLETDFAALALRRGSAFLGLLVVYAAFVALVLGTPTVWLAQAATKANALMVSAGFAIAVFALWRLWPAFGLVFIWDDAYPDENEEGGRGSWMLAAQRRAIAFGAHLARERDPYFARGLPVALSLLIVVAGAMTLAGIGGLLPEELRVSALWLYAFALCPLAHLVIARACERVLLDDLSDDDEIEETVDDVLPVAPPTLPPADGATRNAQLITAAKTGQVDLALAVLESGARADLLPQPQDRDQRSLLMHAAVCADTRLLRALIARGADVNRSIGGLTPLLAATRDSHLGRPDAVLTLVSNGADTRVADAEGNTPLHYAALSCEATVAAILVDAAADVNAVNREGHTPLALAAAAGNETLVRFLLERGAKCEVPRAAPVLVAAMAGGETPPVVLKLLLKAKADPNATDKLGRTALHAAALAGDAVATELLLAAGVQVDARDSHGVTALMEAARAGSNAVLAKLAPKKPDPDFQDPAGRTALLIACQSRQANEETVRRLLDLGADRQRATRDGKRPIDYAIAAGRWTLVALLDPNYALPSALTGSNELGDADGVSRVDLLTRALRHGRIDLAAEVLRTKPPLSGAELQATLLDACDLADRDSLEFLLQHDCPLVALDPLGESLLEQLAAKRPLPVEAIDAVLHAGAPVGGGAALARLLDGNDVVDGGGERLERLALALLERGADPFRHGARARTTLHLAAANGFDRLLDALLARGLDPNALDARGKTPLHELSMLSDVVATHCARRLLVAGADPERAAHDGQTALGAALAAGRQQLARTLSWTQGFRHPGRRLWPSDLPAAAAAGDRGALSLLLDCGLPIDSRDAQGATALLRACGGGHAELATLLLDRGADPTLAAATGATPLSAAVSARRESIVGLLLDRGVSPDQPLPGGSTPLMLAAALGLKPLVDVLLARGAAANAVDDQGNGPIHAAAQFAYHAPDAEKARPLLQRLVDAGAAIDAANAAGQTPLLVLLGARVDARAPAPQRDLVSLVLFLIARGANPNAQDQRGVSALHAAAMHGRLDACEALLGSGADPLLADRLGRTAGEISMMIGYADVGAALKRAQQNALKA